MIKISNNARIIMIWYAVLFSIAFAYHIVRNEYDKFSAIFVGLLTLPWSYWFVEIINRFGLGARFDFVEKNIAMVVMAVINISLIFILSIVFGKKISN